jgi:predicted permease
MDSSATVHEARYGLSVLRAEYREPLLVLMALVGVLLLLACANVANLLLARATGRRRELVLRVALGAGRMRLVRQLLTEAVVLAGIGTIVGVALSRVGVAVLLRLVSGNNVPVPLETPADWRVLAFLTGITAVTAVLAGLIPAFRATRLDLNAALRGSAANVAGSGRGSGRWAVGKILAGVQVALSLVMLVVAGLFVRSLMNLGSVELGYDPAPLAMFRVSAVSGGVPLASAQPFFDDLLTKFAAMPRVKHVTMSENGLFYGSEMNVGVGFPGHTPPAGPEPDIRLDMIGPAYFTTIGIPVVMGRDIQASDTGGLQGCWINQAGVKKFFGAESPIGQRMSIHYSFGERECEIRGVVGDARQGELRRDIAPRAYVPMFPALPNFGGGAIVEMQVTGDPMAMQPEIRRVIQSVNAAVPPPTVHTVPELIGLDLTTSRMTARLSTLFGALALILAAAGIYGVISYSVSRRVTEIGVRLALGAERGAILRMVAGEALGIGIAGAVVGLAASLGFTRYIGTMLFGLGARDPWTITIGIAGLLAVALAAAALPAWRASRTDPIQALRAE